MYQAASLSDDLSAAVRRPALALLAIDGLQAHWQASQVASCTGLFLCTIICTRRCVIHVDEAITMVLLGPAPSAS